MTLQCFCAATAGLDKGADSKIGSSVKIHELFLQGNLCARKVCQVDHHQQILSGERASSVSAIIPE